jgi:hypothetical protein
MYQPYETEEEDSSSADSVSVPGSASDSESTVHDTPEDRVTDGRMQALDQWRMNAQSWINGPGRVPVTDGPGAERTDYGLRNSVLEFEEKRDSHIVMIDSLDRDQRIYPLPTQFRIRLPRIYRNVSRIDILQVKMLSALYAFTEARGNTTLTITDASCSGICEYRTYSATIPDGTYSIQQLVDTLTCSLRYASDASGFRFPYQVVYNCTTGRISIDSSGNPFTLDCIPDTPSTSVVYSEWGLGWKLGFGGAPATISSIQGRVTATHMPRLFDDYIFLRMNDNEMMNTVDHTDLENTKVVQDPTGQVSHYFGKLLLNNFGCYAQTFIEAPKHFHPILGRLDRLSFEWTDRHGVVLNGPDAASCDWHMTVRIIEVKDKAKDTSTLVTTRNTG